MTYILMTGVFCEDGTSLERTYIVNFNVLGWWQEARVQFARDAWCDWFGPDVALPLNWEGEFFIYPPWVSDAPILSISDYNISHAQGGEV